LSNPFPEECKTKALLTSAFAISTYTNDMETFGPKNALTEEKYWHSGFVDGGEWSKNPWIILKMDGEKTVEEVTVVALPNHMMAGLHTFTNVEVKLKTAGPDEVSCGKQLWSKEQAAAKNYTFKFQCPKGSKGIMIEIRKDTTGASGVDRVLRIDKVEATVNVCNV